MRVLVVGLGAFGLWFSKSMLEMGHEVIAIERDEGLVDRYADSVTRGIVGDATDPGLLERVTGSQIDAAVVATGEDLSTTILAIMALREVGLEDIYAAAHSVQAARALERLGVSEAIFPELESGTRLAHRVVSKAVLDYTPIAEGFSLQEIAVPESWTGHSLREVEPREKLEVQVVAVRDALTGEVALPPDPSLPLKPSDSLLIAGRDEILERLSTRGR